MRRGDAETRSSDAERAESAENTGAAAARLVIRRGCEADLEGVAAVQASSPAAAQWNVTEYPQYDFRVADEEGRIAGFLVARRLAEGESEILNLAVSPEARRKGVARALVQAFLRDAGGVVFLEVRESNEAARNLYKSIGFKELGTRREYYPTAPGSSETAIVMKFHSC